MLKKVRTTEDVERIKPEIKEALSKINVADLAIAEQELMAEGITLEEHQIQRGQSYDDFVSRLNEVGGYIVQNLNGHIFKEDNILYPTALQVIPEQGWREIKRKFDEIGYCCLTPSVRAECDC
ncbi:MAG: DUF438 domain-containing protein [Candidatus Bathyarchaeia archaeon]